MGGKKHEYRKCEGRVDEMEVEWTRRRGYGICIFFFKQKTAYEIKECDWSSDVCSSDLIACWCGVNAHIQCDSIIQAVVVTVRCCLRYVSVEDRKSVV